MESATTAAWAQAILSAIAIVISGLIAVAVPLVERWLNARQERRNRLSIVTTAWSPTGLKLHLKYLPEFTHVGIQARVEVLGRESQNIRLHEGRFSHSAAMLTDGTYLIQKVGSVFLGNKGIVRLTALDSENP